MVFIYKLLILLFSFSHFASFSFADPGIDLIFLKFPQTANFMARQAFFTSLFRDRISLDPEIVSNFIYG